MGDAWIHDIEVEREIPAREAKPFALCVGGERIGPPEDCGGSEGFPRFLRSLSGPLHAAERVRYASEGFDLSYINESLRSLDATLPPFARSSKVGNWPALP